MPVILSCNYYHVFLPKIIVGLIKAKKTEREK